MLIDLTRTIRPGMPVYPGTTPPEIRQGATLDEDGFAEKVVTFFSHTGTHMDAPAHIIPGGATLDMLPMDSFHGAGLIVDVRGMDTIDVAVFREHEADLLSASYLVLRTGWEEKWGSDDYFVDFPVMTLEAARFIAELSISGVAVDAISVDPVDSMTLDVHHVLLKAGIVIVENVCNLDALQSKQFTFCALPLKIDDADGAPVRAVGII